MNDGIGEISFTLAWLHEEFIDGDKYVPCCANIPRKKGHKHSSHLYPDCRRSWQVLQGPALKENEAKR